MNIDRIILDRIGTGEKNAAPSGDLETVTGLPVRDVRRRIEALRRAGCVICSSERGYFFPASRSELLRFVMKERKRAGSIKQSLKSAERRLKQWQ